MVDAINDKADIALAEDKLPIREISRETGVNTVTLRAWERRYGLLIPQRTNKGHRLYSRADIERVKEIQLWLERGLAISKVKALLADARREESIAEIDSIWLQLAQQIQAAITKFNRNQIERLIEDTFSLYPSPMIADYLLAPLLADLQGNEPGKSARRAFFSAVLQEYIQASQNRQRQAINGEKILIVSIAPGEGSLLPLLLTFSLLVNQYYAEYMGYLGAKESLLCAEALKAKILVIMGGEIVNASELQLHLTAWRSFSAMPVVLVGDVVRIVPVLSPELAADVHPCKNQQQTLAAINQLLKG